ncbi:hypothetical protein P2H44_11165 [Albimonas sp. CAU 1670]|uniref:hypothetical protein n=1 Tax=Albimonas sp. CAU 1670 TaxID=3032599 RepID=UPI0023DB0172|nr:hypothetical protein [Albimonas sp. CAU 1670]MDF2233112.1 hypothetical protein [Albimonas sp. CAU 1670]
MTDPTPTDPVAFLYGEGGEIPRVIEFHQNTFKLKMMSVMALLVAALFLWTAVSAALDQQLAQTRAQTDAGPTIEALPSVEGPASPSADASGEDAGQGGDAPAGPAEPPSPMIAGVGGLCFALMGLLLWREGAKTQPVLRVTAEGLEDRLFGFVPWANVKSYRLVSSFFSPGFGYSLKKGVRPPKTVALFQFQKAMNMLSGMPARCFRKQMIVGGCDPMLLTFRAHRPELEGK